MVVLLLLTSPPRTLRAVGGGSAAGPSHSRHLPLCSNSVAIGWKTDITRTRRICRSWPRTDVSRCPPFGRLSERKRIYRGHRVSVAIVDNGQSSVGGQARR